MQSRREVQRERSRGTSKRMIRDLLILIILIFLVGWSIYAVGNHPKAEAERQATTIAKRYANLKTRTDFYIYNREKYLLHGCRQKQQGPADSGHRAAEKRLSAGCQAKYGINRTTGACPG